MEEKKRIFLETGKIMIYQNQNYVGRRPYFWALAIWYSSYHKAGLYSIIIIFQVPPLVSGRKVYYIIRLNRVVQKKLKISCPLDIARFSEGIRNTRINESNLYFAHQMINREYLH